MIRILPLFLCLFGTVSSWCADPFVDWIQVSEVMYHPPGAGEDLEFIELVNTGPRPVDLTGWRFSEGISFTFPAGVFLKPGDFLAVCKNRSALEAWAGPGRYIGDYSGNLDNDGEPVALLDAQGRTVFRFRYDDDGDWDVNADGEGASLERIFFQHDPDWGASFRASRVLGGTPGRPSSWRNNPPPGPVLTPCRLNEIEVRGERATVELFNPSESLQSLQGFELIPEGSMDRAVPLDGVEVAPQGTVLVNVDLSGIPGGVLRIFLVQTADLALVDVMKIGGAAQEAVYARYPDATGRVWRVQGATPGAPNDPPPPSPVVFSEINYHPPGGEKALEWVEIVNVSDRLIDLTGWRLTKAVSYTFPDGVTLQPGEVAVVAADPARFASRWGFQPLGPFAGTLADRGEVLRLRDGEGLLVDQVAWADDGPWPRAPDGGGKTLVRLSPLLAGSAPGAWRASERDGGRPGEVSWVEPQAVDPVVFAVMNDPAVPRPGQPVSLRAVVTSPEPISAVSVFWQRDGESSFHQVQAQPAENLPLQGRAFHAVLPGLDEDGVVAFFIEARTTAGRTGRYPPEGEALFPVDSRPDASDTVTFRIVMRASDWEELRSRSPYSDVFLPCTLVYRGKPYYLAKMRFRGRNARHHEPKSYRVDPGHHNRFPLGETLALNAQRHEDQRLGLDLLARCGIPTPRSRFIEVVTDEGHRRDYLQVEMINEDFIRRVFPDEADDGNLYRGNNSADLTYRGDDPDAYRGRYDKKTNTEENDWTDLINLCKTLSDPTLFATEVQNVIHFSEWARWYGVMAILNNEENSLANDRGDDYFIYSDSATGKFWLLPWDLDTILDTPTEPLFRPTLPVIRRFLSWPPAARIYTETIVEELASHARPDVLASRLAPAEAFDTDPVELAKLRDNAAVRARFLNGEIPRKLTVEADTAQAAALVRWHDTWRYFKGKTDPAPGIVWTEPQFDDSSWQLGQGGFGYGDNDDTTVLADMRRNYSTLYLRKTFTVGDPTSVETLTLKVWIDDGFVAYLNGIEVARYNAGRPGSILDHTATADNGIEPRERAFQIQDPQTLLRSGKNVLAILGLNSSVQSGDFSLDAFLSAGGAEGESYGTGEVIVATRGQVRLFGLAPPYLTVEVKAGGRPAFYDVKSFGWETFLNLLPGSNPISLGLYDETEALRLTHSVTVYFKEPGRLSGVIDRSLTLSDSEGPYLIQDQTVIEQDAQVSCRPGAALLVLPGARVTVRGTFEALGTRENPVLILPATSEGGAGGFVIEPGGRFEAGHLKVRGIGTDGAGAIEVQGGSVTVSASRFEDLPGWALRSRGGIVRLSDITVEDAQGGILIEDTDAEIWCLSAQGLREEPAVRQTGGRLALKGALIQGGETGLRIDGAASLSAVTCIGVSQQAFHILSRTTTGSFIAALQSTVGLLIDSDGGLSLDHATVAGCVTGAQVSAGGSFTVEDSIFWFNEDAISLSGGADFSARFTTGPTTWPGDGNQATDPIFQGGGEARYGLSPESPCAANASDGDFRGAFPVGASVPEITELFPQTGSTRGGTLIKITGRNFTEVSVVLFDGVPASEISFVSSTTLTAKTPPHAEEGTVEVKVWNQLGPSTRSGAFTYRAAILRGDVNGSEKLDISDAVYLLRYLFGFGEPPVCLQAGDVNNDGAVDLSDVTALLAYLFAGGPAPQPPQADCP